MAARWKVRPSRQVKVEDREHYVTPSEYCRKTYRALGELTMDDIALLDAFPDDKRRKEWIKNIYGTQVGEVPWKQYRAMRPFRKRFRHDIPTPPIQRTIPKSSASVSTP